MRKRLPNSIFLFNLIICFSFFSRLAVSQQHKIDSLKVRLTQKIHDTDRVNTLNYLSEGLWRQANYDTAFIYAKNAKKLAEKIGFKKGIFEAYINTGIIYGNRGDFSDALKNYFVALKISEVLGDSLRMAISYGKIGGIYCYQGNYSDALKNHIISLKIAETLGDKKKCPKHTIILVLFPFILEIMPML